MTTLHYRFDTSQSQSDGWNTIQDAVASSPIYKKYEIPLTNSFTKSAQKRLNRIFPDEILQKMLHCIGEVLLRNEVEMGTNL